MLAVRCKAHFSLLACNRALRSAATTTRAVPESTERITSTGNAYVKHCVKLRTSAKHRLESGSILLVGYDLLQEAAGTAKGACLHVRTLILNEAQPQVQGTISEAWLIAQRTVLASEPCFKKLTGLESAARVDAAAEIDLPPPVDFMLWPPSSSSSSKEKEITESSENDEGIQGPGSRQHSTPASPPSTSDSSSVQGSGVREECCSPKTLRRLLALDGVQDPGNLGTLMRSALAFGWDGVFLLPGCCSPFNDKAIKSSRGAVLRMAIGSGSLQDLLKVAQHHHLRLIAADLQPEEDSPTDTQASNQPSSNSEEAVGGVCLVLGSEGQGLSQAASDVCAPVMIPMAGRMESLNVGIAGGILMWALSEGGAHKLFSRLSRLNVMNEPVLLRPSDSCKADT